MFRLNSEINAPVLEAGGGNGVEEVAMGGELQKMDGNDQIYYWIHPEHSMIHAIQMVGGDLPVQAAEKWVESLLTDPQLSKFSMRIKKEAGNKVFWQKISQERQAIQRDSLRLLRLDENRPGREQLKELVENLLTSPLPEERLQWEVWLLKNYKDSVESEPKSVILFRSHHAYSDGIGLVNSLFKSLGVDLDSVKYPGQRLHLSSQGESPRRSTSLWSHPIQSTLAWINYIKALLHHIYIHINPPREPRWNPLGPSSERQGGSQKLAWLKAPLETEILSKIAKKHNVKFNSVLYTLMTGAIRSFLQEASPDDLKIIEKQNEQLHAYLPVSLRAQKDFTSKGQIMGNRLGAMGTPLYVDIEDPIERMKKLNSYVQSFTRGAGMFSIGLFSRLFASRPTLFKDPVLMRKFSNMYSAVFTTMPGPTEPLSFNFNGKSYPFEEMSYFLPRELVHNIPIVFSSFSYAGKVQIGLSLSGDLEFEGKTITPEQVLTYVSEVYEVLKGEVQ